jgi:hypothetical protein
MCVVILSNLSGENMSFTMIVESAFGDHEVPEVLIFHTQNNILSYSELILEYFCKIIYFRRHWLNFLIKVIFSYACSSRE